MSDSIPSPNGGGSVLRTIVLSIVAPLVVSVLGTGAATVVNTTSRVSVLETQMGEIQRGIGRIEKRLDRQEQVSRKEAP